MLLPASIGSGESHYVSCIFAWMSAVVASILVLSEVSGSLTPEVVLAVLEMLAVREEIGRASCREGVLAPEVIVVRLKPTTPAVSVPPLEAETKLVPAGIASDRLAPVASDGPLLVTVSV